MAQKPLVIEYRDLDEIVPYENNPRRIEPALPALVNSLLQFGWRVPVVVDSNNVLVAGHARCAAARRIVETMPERAEDFRRVPVLVASDMTEEQIKAFRLVDNKVASLASWDFDLLAGEFNELIDLGVDLTQFGWTKEEVDCISSIVHEEECLKAPSGPIDPKSARNHAIQERFLRVVIGDVSFYVFASDFDVWMTEERRKVNWDMRALTDSLAERLGLLEAKKRYDQANRS